MTWDGVEKKKAVEHYARQLEWARDKRDAEILRWMLDEPEASRHLLREGKGDKESFRTMIERLKRSKESIAKERAR